MDYKSSGVDIDAGTEVVERVKSLAKSTFTDGVLSDIGSFGGLFKPELSGMTEPVLVASADEMPSSQARESDTESTSNARSRDGNDISPSATRIITSSDFPPI